MLVDAHCHFNSLVLNIKDLEESGKIFIDSSIDYNTSKISIELSKEYNFIFSSIGLHPLFLKDFSEDLIKKYLDFLYFPKVLSIGEIGLDYKSEYDLKLQEYVFRKFIEIAISFNLPIVIHCRFDFNYLLNILDEYSKNYENIMFHCFSYSIDILKKIISKNGFVSFSLNVLRKNKLILESLAECPLDNLILETDFPYIKIENKISPFYIENLYSFVSAFKNIEKEKLEDIIYSNVKRLFFKDEKKSSYFKNI